MMTSTHSSGLTAMLPTNAKTMRMTIRRTTKSMSQTLRLSRGAAIRSEH